MLHSIGIGLVEREERVPCCAGLHVGQGASMKASDTVTLLEVVLLSEAESEERLLTRLALAATS